MTSSCRDNAGSRRARYGFDDIIGAGTACRGIQRLGQRAAALDTTVLLLGESVSGAQLAAFALALLGMLLATWPERGRGAAAGTGG